MSSPDRQELLRNAVAFLTDPNAGIPITLTSQSSPLAQKLQFLEAKGLTPAEVDMALRQAAASAPPPPHYVAAYGHNPYGLVQQSPQRWDWRDYFITGVISGTIVYGAASLFRKFLLPHLQPPESTAYEQDRDALNAQFDAAEALLKEIKNETAAVRVAVEEQKAKVDRTTEDVKAVVTEMREGEVKTRDEIREIREEVNTIREMLPKMIEKNKDSQTQSLGELQQELKSLKALLLSRGPTISSTPSTPIPMLGRPAIPAWQLASTPQATPMAAPQTNGATEMSSSATSQATTVTEGKGKGVDREDPSTES